MKRVLTEGPLETAVRLLARRDHSEQELQIKLKRSGYSSEIINSVVEQLRMKGYLDDEKIKRQSIEKLIAERHYGSRMIIGKLRLKGLSVSLEELRQCYSIKDEMDTAEKLINKRFDAYNAETCPKIIRFLNNRGFSQDVLSRMAEKSLKHQY